MREKVLLTLGRLPKALELARALSKAGAEVHVADPWRSHLSRPSRSVSRRHGLPPPASDSGAYADALWRIIDQHKIDHVFPVSEEILHVAPLKERLGERMFSPTANSLIQLHNKHAFIDLARNHGLKAPDTFAADTEEARQFVDKSDYVVKPLNGCSGKGLSLKKAGTPLSAAENAPHMVLQRRIYGRELSSFSIARNGRTLGTVVYRGLILAGSVACCFERVDDAADAEHWARDFVAAEKYTGFIGFDFIEDQNGIAWPIECNPRMTSGIHFMVDDDVAAAALDCAFRGHVRLKRQTAFQEGHTALTMAYKDLFKPQRFLGHLRNMARSEDVLFRLDDPLPFFLMTPMSWRLLIGALLRKQSFGEAATADLAWTAPPTRDSVNAFNNVIASKATTSSLEPASTPANDEHDHVKYGVSRGK